MGFCPISSYLPYYIDPDFTFKAPIVSGTDAYDGIDSAIDGGKRDLRLRGQLRLTHTAVVNLRPQTLSSDMNYSCCATIHVSDNVSPAFLVVYENFGMSFITMSMGASTGGFAITTGHRYPLEQLVFFRNNQTTVNIGAIASASLLDVLLTEGLVTGNQPQSTVAVNTLMDNVQIINGTTSGYDYGVISMKLARTTTFLRVIRSMIKGKVSSLGIF